MDIQELFEAVSSTPRRTLYDKERTEGAVTSLRTSWLKASELVRGMFGGEVVVDEMAALVSSEEGFLRWHRSLAMLEGYELFNAANDRVDTRPITSKYDVEYSFFRTPFDYRIELMRVVDGFSPIHSLLSMSAAMYGHDEHGGIVGVHASFKANSEETYGVANHLLAENDWECALRCQSTYGKFSYWVHDNYPNWYLKPRVNLRDAK